MTVTVLLAKIQLPDGHQHFVIAGIAADDEAIERIRENFEATMQHFPPSLGRIVAYTTDDFEVEATGD